MTRGLSLYLDLFRFSAALVVFISHLSYIPYTGRNLSWSYDYGPVAVMAFFVLSGYVIGYTSDKKHKAFDDYLIARLARLYSVVIPALFLTLVLDFIGSNLMPELYQKIPSSHPLLRFIATLLFMQESWGLSMSYFSDTPLWSVAYEFWYYMLFGIAMYLPGRSRYVGLLFTSILIGPRILVLFPIWLLGLLAYKVHASGTAKMPKYMGLTVFVASLLLIIFMTSHPIGREIERNMHVMQSFPEANEFLTWSRFFLYDYMIGLFFFLHILSARHVMTGFMERFLEKNETVIRYFAGITFSIYIFHMPLMYFFRAITGYDTNKFSNGILCGIAVLVTCALLARITESKKSVYQGFLMKISNPFKRRIV